LTENERLALGGLSTDLRKIAGLSIGKPASILARKNTTDAQELGLQHMPESLLMILGDRDIGQYRH
jgi:hypothetical protein